MPLLAEQGRVTGRPDGERWAAIHEPSPFDRLDPVEMNDDPSKDLAVDMLHKIYVPAELLGLGNLCLRSWHRHQHRQQQRWQQTKAAKEPWILLEIQGANEVAMK
jgi:hypothetical protein